MILFIIALIKCSVCPYLSFYFYSFRKLRLVFHVPVLLNAVQMFFLSVNVTRNTADITTLYINSLTSIFARHEYNTLFRDFTQL